MNNVIVNQEGLNNIISGLKDVNDSLYFLRFLVAIFVHVLEWICVQNGWKSDVQYLKPFNGAKRVYDFQMVGLNGLQTIRQKLMQSLIRTIQAKLTSLIK